MKHIPGYEKLYAIDRQGQVWRIGAPRGRPLTPVLVSGYLRVVLCQNNIKKRFFVHQLMLLTYVGPKPDGQVPRHINGDKKDNHLKNLAWGTLRENMIDRDRHGTTAKGERHGAAKLTEEQVKEILERHGRTIREMAAHYGVSKATIDSILYGRNWRHMK